MRDGNYITVIEFCSVNNIEPSFLSVIEDYGLIELVHAGDELFIYMDQIPVLEKIIMLHYELDINIEGIETIMYLLNRNEKMQDEIINLRNRLRIYEDPDLFNH